MCGVFITIHHQIFISASSKVAQSSNDKKTKTKFDWIFISVWKFMCLAVYWFKVLSCIFTTLPVRNQNKILKMWFVIFFSFTVRKVWNYLYLLYIYFGVRVVQMKHICMFGPLKKAIKGCRFWLDEDVKVVVVQRFRQRHMQRGSISWCIIGTVACLPACLPWCLWKLDSVASLLHPGESWNGFHLNNPHLCRGWVWTLPPLLILQWCT